MGTQAQESKLKFASKTLDTYILDSLYQPTSASGKKHHHLCMIKTGIASLLSAPSGDPSATLPLHLNPLKDSLEKVVVDSCSSSLIHHCTALANLIEYGLSFHLIPHW